MEIRQILNKRYDLKYLEGFYAYLLTFKETGGILLENCCYDFIP